MDWPIPCHRQGAGGRQPELERGKLGPRDSNPYQTVNRLPVANQDFLGLWMVDIRRGSQSEISSPEETHSTPETNRVAGMEAAIRCSPQLAVTELTKHLVT